jgi:hypothetical protein
MYNVSILFISWNTKNTKNIEVQVLVDHAPNGFNGKFIKKCWPIIKADFLRSDQHQQLDRCLDS